MTTRRGFIGRMMALAAVVQFHGFIPEFELPELATEVISYFYRVRYPDGSYGPEVGCPTEEGAGTFTIKRLPMDGQVEVGARIEGDELDYMRVLNE